MDQVSTIGLDIARGRRSRRSGATPPAAAQRGAEVLWQAARLRRRQVGRAMDAALADARLAGQQHLNELRGPLEAKGATSLRLHLAFAVLRQAPPFHQEAEFVLAADKTGQPAGPYRFEAALGGRHPLDRPGLDRLGETLDLMPTERLQPEQIADQPARGCGDDYGAGLGQGLQPRGQVWRLADDRPGARVCSQTANF